MTNKKSTSVQKRLSVDKLLNTGKVRFLFSLLFLSIISINMGKLLINEKDKYFSTNYWDRYPSLKKAYYDSVYANKNGTWVPDEVLYSFNGGALITGTSPILVNPEIPPVGKYLIGISTILFKNEHIIIFIFGLVSLFGMYKVGMQIFKNTTLSLVAPALITFETFFKNQFVYTPLIDIFQLTFLLFSFYFFNKALITKKNSLWSFILSSFFIGLFISTKFFATGATIVAAFIFVLFMNKEFKKIILFLFSLLVSIFVLLGSYVRVLIIGYPFMKFLGIQKWVYWYNQGHLHNQFSIWPLIFLNKWHQYDGRILNDPQWSFTWPASVLLLGISTATRPVCKMSHKKEAEVLIVWSILYLCILSLSDATARYLVILLPILFIVGVYVMQQIYFFMKRKSISRIF